MSSATTKFAVSISAAALACFGISNLAHADPLPGEVLKFQQLPLNNLNVLPPAIYQGHNESSTAHPVAGQTFLQGTFAADDFGDKLTSPIVHLKWWGGFNSNPNNTPLTQFLISFEADVPGVAGTFSHPGQPLLSQIVNLGALAPGSGTFVSTPFNSATGLIQYNAELNLGSRFPEVKDTVYWLKIVALSQDPSLDWGWHNRDYSQQDTFASPAVVPGEGIIGFVGPATFPTPVWHFQDDAVAGQVRITPSTGGPIVQQPLGLMAPLNYKDFIDGPPAGPGSTAAISTYSEDLAFEVYTVPEPSAIGAIGIIAASLMMRRRAHKPAVVA